MKHAHIFLFGFGLVFALACNDNGLNVNENVDGGKKDGSASVDMLGSNNKDMPMQQVGDMTGGPADLKGVSCGTETCNSSQQCCVQSTGAMSFAAMCVGTGQCADGGLVASCDGPEDCSISGQGCCVDVTVSFGGGMSMNPSGTGGSACAATCEANAVVDTGAGMANIKSALCHQNTDCVGLVGNVDAPFIGGPGQTFNRCCTAMQGGTTLSFCAPDSVATFGSIAMIDCQ